MTKPKLPHDTQPLDELITQAFHLGSTIGKNIQHLRKHFANINNTTGIALLRRLAQNILEKGIRNFSGVIKITPGIPRQGRQYRDEQGRKRHELIGHSFYSGKKLATVYPVSFSLQNDGKPLVAAGRTLGTQLAFEDMIGPDHIDTALVYLPLLNDPKMEDKLSKTQHRPIIEREKQEKQTLEELLAGMPEDFTELLRDHDVDLAPLRFIGFLQEGQHIAKGYFSPIHKIFDPGQRRNGYNWVQENFKQHTLPTDVRQAWLCITTHPHLKTVEHVQLVRKYLLQAFPLPREGVAGEMPAELRWLATSKEAEEARQLYNQKIDLTINHNPARIYDGNVPTQPMSVEKKLADPYWTIADYEGIRRCFPLAAFRKGWNRKMLANYFGSGPEFEERMKELIDMHDEDAKCIAMAKGPEKAYTKLGNDYPFVDSIVKWLQLNKTCGKTKREALINGVWAHESRDKFKRLYVIAQKVHLYNTTKNADVLNRDYVPVKDIVEKAKTELGVEEIMDRVKGSLWLFGSPELSNDLSRAGLAEHQLRSAINNAEQIILEARHGLIRKELAGITSTGNSILQGLYTLVKDATEAK